MKLSKAIAEIQNEYGFTKEEEGDPRLAAIDRIAQLDAQIRSRREELLAAEESVPCVCVRGCMYIHTCTHTYKSTQTDTCIHTQEIYV